MIYEVEQGVLKVVVNFVKILIYKSNSFTAITLCKQFTVQLR